MADQLQSLDYQLIERASEKYSNIREVVIRMDVDGVTQEFIVEIYKHFSPLNIKMCVQELVEKLDLVRVNDGSRFETAIIPYMMFLTIKHFTTLKLPNIFAEQLKAIEHMTNTGTMFQIFTYMDQDEINKVRDEVQFVVENINSNMDEIEEFKKEIKAKLFDKSLLE